jgi:hypothetical protein
MVNSNHSASLKVNQQIFLLLPQQLRLPLFMEKQPLMLASKNSKLITQSVVLHQYLEEMLDWLLQNINAKLVIWHPV